MVLNLLDESFELVDVIDTFNSVIWTDRIYEPGDFELYLPYTKHFAETLKLDYYLTQKQSTKVMIIESIKFASSVENGATIMVSGRSLESILDRRIVWYPITVEGDLQSQIEKLLLMNVIIPEIAQRTITNFVFKRISDPLLNTKLISAQYYGDNLLDVVETTCRENKIGFSIELSEEDKKFIFSLVVGIDRSYDQDVVPYLVFSPKFNNLINSNYITSKKIYKNVALVAGENYPDSEDRKTDVSGNNSLSGLSRREIFSDAYDISSKIDDGEEEEVVMPDELYFSLLRQRGAKELSEYKTTKIFDGDMETTRVEYQKDFFMGDIVQVSDAYDSVVNTPARIIEMIFSEDRSGLSAYPTFEID